MPTPLHLFQKKKTGSKGKKILVILLSGIIALGIWFLYSLNGLRIFIPYYPWLTGFPFQSKNYLIVFQNEAEMRPGGGFITAYGHLRFVSGFPVAFDIHDVYDLMDTKQAYVEPPYPLGEYLQSPYSTGWSFQDSNWFPDFGEDAQKMIWFYNRRFPNDAIDGVIAVNFNVLENLIDLVGPVTIDGTVFNRANLFSLLEYNVSNVDQHNINDLQSRKDILKQFYEKMFYALFFSPIKYSMITSLLEEKLNQKEIQLYCKDRLLSNMIDRKGWSGTIPFLSGSDYLMVSEANLTGMKSDRYIRRSVAYRVDIDAQKNADGHRKATAMVTIRMQHDGDENKPLSSVYTGFIRVFIPKGSVVLNADNTTVQAEEDNFLVLGKTVEINPGESTTISFHYILPSTMVSNDQYHLYINKQSGTNDVYSVTVHTPQDFLVMGKKWELKDNIARFTALLSDDVDLDLHIVEDHIPPRIISQTFKDLHTIEIHFNEPVDQHACEKISNYAVEDKNVQHPKTDTVHVLSVSCDPEGAMITLSGVTKQDNEQYVLTVQNIQDLYGNLTFPNPRTITVVQRLP
jgi:hypothetical protein